MPGRPRPARICPGASSRRTSRVHGLRNSLLIAIAPTATIASIAGCYECIEPQLSNLFKRETLSGDFLQINGYLVDELKGLGLWNDALRDAIKLADGSVQELTELPPELRRIYRTAWELPMRGLIDMAAQRAAYIDQSQSLNLFMAIPTSDSSRACTCMPGNGGLKTTYYLRSRPATAIAKTTVRAAGATDMTGTDTAGIVEAAAIADATGSAATDAVACSLENPESCEACQ